MLRIPARRAPSIPATASSTTMHRVGSRQSLKNYLDVRKRSRRGNCLKPPLRVQPAHPAFNHGLWRDPILANQVAIQLLLSICDSLHALGSRCGAPKRRRSRYTNGVPPSPCTWPNRNQRPVPRILALSPAAAEQIPAMRIPFALTIAVSLPCTNQMSGGWLACDSGHPTRAPRIRPIRTAISIL